MINETQDENELLRKKSDAYCILNKKVHISYKNGMWKRGIIKEVNAEFFILVESLEGDMPVFYQEIKSIEPYKVRGVTDEMF